MIVTRTSEFSGITRSIDLPVTQEQLDKWDNGNGPHIQHVFPHLTDNQREFILSGITEEEWDEWDEMFPEDDVPLEQDKYDRGEIEEL